MTPVAPCIRTSLNMDPLAIDGFPTLGKIKEKLATQRNKEPL